MKLRRILIRNWGPIDILDLTFPSNLGIIYGKNEKGKTSIMEAVLLSLSGSPEQVFTYLRKGEEFVGNCSLELSLSDGRIVRREYPSKRKRVNKVERVRLLFSWPGEAYQGNLAKDMLTGLILPQEILVWNPIKGLGVDDIRDGRLIGFQRGKFKEYLRLKKELDALQREEERFYALSLSDVVELEDKVNRIEKDLSVLLLAKKALARELYRELDEVENELRALPEEKVQKILAIKQAMEKLKSLRLGLEDRLKLMVSQEDLLWWQSLLEQRGRLDGWKGKIALIGAGILLILSVLAPWWWLRVIGSVSVLILGFFVWRIINVKKGLRIAEEQAGRKFVSWDQVEDFVSRLEKERAQAVAIETQISDLRAEEEKEKMRLVSLVGSEEADDFLQNHQIKKQRLERRRKELLERLSSLGIRREDTEDGVVGNYDERQERMLREELESAKRELDKRRAENEGFLSSMAIRFGLTDWTVKELFVGLKREKQELENRIKELAIEFVSAVAWRRVLSELKGQQYQKVTETLNEARFKDYLSLFSGGRFVPERIKALEEDIIFRMPEGKEYRFSLLSAGARHQVLFAVKSALLERIYPETRFIILDDAFIFSDTERLNEALLALSRLSKVGWQVIYLTIDERARDILAELGAEVICL